MKTKFMLPIVPITARLHMHILLRHEYKVAYIIETKQLRKQYCLWLSMGLWPNVINVESFIFFFSSIFFFRKTLNSEIVAVINRFVQEVYG